MFKKSLKLVTSITFTLLVISGCANDDVFNNTAGNILTNVGTVSSNNFTVLLSDFQPLICDPMTGCTQTEIFVTAFVGDRNNNPLTDGHVVSFATEWGLIENTCTTLGGSCTVSWFTSDFLIRPGDELVTIVAYTSGEESFTDFNSNGVFDDFDGLTFTDTEEPFIDIDAGQGAAPNFNGGDIVIDVVNAIDLTGLNSAHDTFDTFFNGGGCLHSTLCSTVYTSATVWDQIVMKIDGP